MLTEKKCKGTGKAKGHGCGELVPQVNYGQANRVYGLGKSCGCYQKWLWNTREGKLKISQTLSQTSRKLKREQEKLERKAKKLYKEKMTIELMTTNQYRSKVLQPVLNEIARLIDYGQPCIATGNYGKENGGHYISVGANVTISMNLHNIHIQSFESNHHKSGDTVNYQNGIRQIYGQEYLDFMDSLNGCEALHLSKQDLIELHKKAKEIRKGLKAVQKPLPAKVRIKIRNEVNNLLGIYPSKYSTF